MADDDSPERRPPRGLASRDAPSASRRYSVFVGVAFVALVVFALVNSLSTDEGGLLGTESAANGAPVPPFSVPDALELAGGRRERLRGRLRELAQPVPGGRISARPHARSRATR